MRRNFKVIIIVIIVLAILSIAAAAYFMPTTHYKTIEINGYTIEVPDSNSTAEKINDNYKIYNDQQNNITIKSYAINNINQTNYTGVKDITEQIKNNNATNTTIANKTVANKSDTYTYYELEQHQMIVITTKDKNTMEHILQNMNKTQIKPENAENINLTQIQENNNTTNNTTQQTTTKKKTTTTTSSKNKKTSSDDTWGDYEDDTYVYGHGAGSSPDPDITWKHNKKTGYGEYYNRKTGERWGGYNIA
ncbi:MAG: hypothetical protein E7Z86_08115 [Methanosphaera stadtmanae]|nr:hypothetical protein [Methanosphaera stadtmanae]